MIFKEIKNALQNDYHKRFTSSVEALKDTESLNHFVRWSLNKRESYKGDFVKQKEKAINQYKKMLDKQLKQELEFIQRVEESKEFSNFSVMVEWKKSYMWGSNPKSYTNYGFESESIGGCGYDKLSTATAYALNSYLPLIKLLMLKEERRLKDKKQERRAYIGYGSGYGIIPKFEGGVGVDCHKSICEGLGLKFECVANTPSTNVYTITQ